MWVIAVVFVISAFIAGKAWEKSNRNELIKMAMDNYHKTMEPVYTEKFKEFVHKDERSLMAAMIDELNKGTRWRKDALECIQGCYPKYFDGKQPK